MASRLYAWAHWMVRRRRWVIATWVLLLAVVGGLGATLHGRTSTEFTIPGVEAQRAQDLLKEKFPPAAGGVVRIVVAAPDGETITAPAQLKVLDGVLREAATVDGVIDVSRPAEAGTVSADRTIAYSDVRFADEAPKVSEEAKEELTTAVEPLRDAGMPGCGSSWAAPPCFRRPRREARPNSSVSSSPSWCSPSRSAPSSRPGCPC